MLRLLVSAGGTGGGVYPALAIVGALEENTEVLWVGSEGGMEEALVGRKGFAFEAVPAAGVHGVGLRALPGNLCRMVSGVPAARRVIQGFRPDVLLFTGGFVGVPVALAGWRLPKVVYVPDIEPALALRMISRRADVVAVTTEASRAFYGPGQRVVVTGYPTRAELERVDRSEARTRLALDPDRPVVLVFGGSRGARSINQALWSCLTELLIEVQVVHITGELDWPQIDIVRGGLSRSAAIDYHAFAYLHDEMPYALAAADLAVSRAGAATLGEYTVLGLPSVLVPYPHAWRYQEVNAEYLVSHGAAVMVADEDLNEALLPTVLALLTDPDRLRSMAKAASSMATRGAARAIAAEIEDLTEKRGSAHG